MRLEGWFDGLALMLNLLAILLLFRGWLSRFRYGTKVLFTGIVHLLFFINLSNTLEWLGITAALDIFEDYIEILIPIMTGFFFYSCVQDLAERELQAREERLKLALEGTNDGLWDWDIPSEEIFYSPRWQAMLGYEPGEINGRVGTWENSLHPEDKSFATSALQDHLDGKTTFYEAEYRLRAKDGSWRWILDRGKVVERDRDQKPLRVVGVHTDITERRQLQAALTESEESFRILTENLKTAVYTFNSKGCFTYVNPATVRITGYTEKELLQMNFFDLVHPNSREKARESGLTLLNSGNAQANYEFRILTKDGTERWVEVSNARLQLRNEPIILGTAFDVTERKNYTQQLTSARDFYLTLFERFPTMIWRTDQEGQCDYVNRTSLDFMGLQLEQCLGQGWLSAIHPEDVEYCQQIFKEAFDSQRPYEMEYRLRHYSGEYHWVIDMGTPYTNLSGQFAGYVGSSYDINARKAAEAEKETIHKQLLQAQKLESVGKLAGGIAHDFNNLLTVIMGNAQMMMLNLREDDPLYHDMDQIVKASTRAANLTRQLLQFSRKQPLEFSTLNPNQLILGLLKMLERLIGEDIRITTDLADDLSEIRADQGNIEQIITNLVVNARDAMPKGGNITLRTRMLTLHPANIQANSEARPGDFICLTIQDTGIGMDENTLQKIFEPFFSTKEVGKGTGLGLSVVYGIVKQHNGWIDVKSQPGKGSSFIVYLPADTSAMETAWEETQQLENLQGKGERILVVEDESDLREFTFDLLTEWGYVVFAAKDAREAQKIFKKESGHFQLLLSDFVMPGANGYELAQALVRQNPNLKVLISSGYTEDKVAHSDIKASGYGFIQKPYNIQKLLETIVDILNDKTAS